MIIGMFLLMACGSSREVSRIDPETVIDLSGDWNDSDARLVAEEMISDCITRVWITDFAAANGDKPVVTVGTVRNKSSEHIVTETFTNDFERELINSGKVRFVASRGQRGEIRDERMDQQEHASDETVKQLAQEIGADFLLMGSISTITDQIEGRKIVFYQTDLEMINIETNEKVWIGSKEIKKDITQSGKKW